jgi:hypothetical protein
MIGGSGVCDNVTATNRSTDHAAAQRTQTMLDYARLASSASLPDDYDNPRRLQKSGMDRGIRTWVMESASASCEAGRSIWHTCHLSRLRTTSPRLCAVERLKGVGDASKLHRGRFRTPWATQLLLIIKVLVDGRGGFGFPMSPSVNRPRGFSCLKHPSARDLRHES